MIAIEVLETDPLDDRLHLIQRYAMKDEALILQMPARAIVLFGFAVCCLQFLAILALLATGRP